MPRRWLMHRGDWDGFSAEPESPIACEVFGPEARRVTPQRAQDRYAAKACKQCFPGGLKKAVGVQEVIVKPVNE